MPKSKIKEFSPVIKDGEQSSYINKHENTMYPHNIEFVNGDKGIVDSSKQNPTWNTYSEYTYNIQPNGKYPNRIFGMKEVKMKNAGGYNDPDSIKQTVMSVCQSAAISLVKILKIEYSKKTKEDAALAFYSWVIAEGSRDRNEASLRWNAIIRAVETIELLDADLVHKAIQGKNVLSLVIQIASEDMNLLKSILNE